MAQLTSLIGSILLITGRPVTLKELEKLTGEKPAALEIAIAQLQTALAGCGIIILENKGSYLMASDPQHAEVVKNIISLETREKLTDAAIETLAIIAYKQPIPRHEIEAIRGVNSQYTLRLLLMRGLIERIPSPKHGRINLYQTTHEFLQHMGLRRPEDLPDFAEITKDIKPPADVTPVPNPPHQGEGQGEGDL